MRTHFPMVLPHYRCDGIEVVDFILLVEVST